MKQQSSICLVFILSIIIPSSAIAKDSFKKVSSFFGAKPYEQVFHKEYILDEHGALDVTNINGSIRITTAWNQNKVMLKAIKKAPQEPLLQQLNVVENYTQDNHLVLKTKQLDEKAKGSIDYELLVPATITLRLETDNGNIEVNHTSGPIDATTTQGNIHLVNVANTIQAKTEKNGAITIEQPHNTVHASSHKGSITIIDACNSIQAETKHGKISVACKEIPSTGSICLESGKGAIELFIPKTTNACIKARTAQGKLMSDHFINVNPLLTKLDSNAWERFKKEVDGTIGSGEATIKLSSHYGNIKILELVS